MKLTKRKGFNFFRSYYDVYNELETPEDKVAFMDALLDRQFQGVKPEGLKGMAKFAYISQVNSIDSQVKGFEDKTGLILNPTPTEPPNEGVKKINLTPTQQVEVKEKVQVQGKVKEKEKEKPLLFTSILDATSLSENENIAFSFWTLFKENLIATGISKTSTLDKANVEKWTNDVRLMIENDKRTVQEIRTVWHFLKSNEFWKKNIQSTSKLREQFERLFQEAKTIKPKDQKEQARKDWGEDLARRLKAMYNN